MRWPTKRTLLANLDLLASLMLSTEVFLCSLRANRRRAPDWQHNSLEGICVWCYTSDKEGNFDHLAARRITKLDAAKAIRFQAFLEQLRRAEAASSFSEAYELLCQTLNEVEDRLTDIAYNPDNFQTDGRMYPPQEDTQRVVVGQQGVVRFRSRGHHTFISSNGSIEIQELSSQAATVVFTKTGADGRGVWE